jgi:hypothetical protein
MSPPKFFIKFAINFFLSISDSLQCFEPLNPTLRVLRQAFREAPSVSILRSVASLNQNPAIPKV